ncbi:fumarylacetoacetate hydrolase family protein [Peribacillus huizhouensis]|uniref:2-keto-4-pentenoate hydratase/2-oxohepta-3-ene-1,7-dioic acid hydratase in catechol pathway n=1 Tax=Peribacillus huizhouensis TaxID=1501239 RepID=A0ABR6CM84_9BACI|nr:fumarylacetoacetate hydrolase family protein [Peribacillus huizhouensis]MBA9026034.1 2-keto-4-pentenoate hydratase/2-oxohepta-3-ene-1,7-dioic acid hydratase in catechol pathway [Peribacillus huizhouensis]
MRLISFRNQSKTRIGVIKEDKILDVQALHEKYKNQISVDSFEFPTDLKQLIEMNEKSIPYVEQLIESHGRENLDHSFSLSEVEIMAPISQPEKIICVGLNYLDHCKETGLEPPLSPVIFSKYANAIIGEKEAIEIPVNSEQVDFEAELVVVIGKEAKRITEEEAAEYIFGYTIMNDVSARDHQFSDGQWTRGKSADTFAPIGPAIVTKGQVVDPHNLDISLKLNGEVMQQSNTKNLIFRIPYIVSYLSQSMTLKPGDLIATGTPPGVGMGREPKVWLKDGDRVSITIENIGTLSNTVEKVRVTQKT